MSSLDMFKKRMSATSGSSMRDEIIKNSKQLLQSTFLDDASANPYITFWNTTTKLVCRIWGRKKSSSLVIATIQTFIDSTVTVGDILYDSHDKEYWMCTNLFNVDDVHKQGELTLCNYILKFQHQTTGIILSYPCITSTNSSIGIDSNNVISTGNSIFNLKLPFDENTSTLREDRRLFVDRDTVKPRSYKITKVNNTEYAFGSKGLIEFTLEQTVGAYPKDRIDLGICNYTDPNSPTPPVGATYSDISYSGELVVGGSKRTLTVVMHNADGTINTTVTPVWNIVFPVGYEGEFTKSSSGYNYYITVAENYDLIDLNVAVSVSDGLGGYVGNLTMTITA